MDIKTYMNYDPNYVPGDFASAKRMESESKEIALLDNYKKVINAISKIGTDAYIYCDENAHFSKGMFSADFLSKKRWYVVTVNPDGTLTLQENKENGEIIYLIDNYRYQKSFVNKMINIIKHNN